MQAFQRDLSRFEKLSAQVLGVSSDDLETHRKFSEQYDLTFPLIADEQGELAKAFGRGRMTFIIDRQGIIRFVQKGIPDNEELLEQLQKLQQ